LALYSLALIAMHSLDDIWKLAVLDLENVERLQLESSPFKNMPGPVTRDFNFKYSCRDGNRPA